MKRVTGRKIVVFLFAAGSWVVSCDGSSETPVGSGGTSLTGGNPGAGGLASTGGALIGGSSSGGTATGGKAVNAGGTPAGGTGTGGAPTGGKATGGVATGGSPVGGSGGIFKPPFILGADISWTLQDEAGGAKYVEGGVTKSIERIFANNGFNFIRLRTFVCPSCSGGYSSQGFCDTAHTITMAKRVKACRMGLFLDFHMSDTWASIGEQNVPSAWAGMSATQMQAAAHDYVKGVLQQMVTAGVKPDMVQVGNEINSHMSGVSISNWGNFSGLVNAGIRAVRETDPNIIVWAQHGRPRPDGNFTPWVDEFLAGNPVINVDGICGSTYGTTNNGADWLDQFGYVINTYDKPVMSCEYTDERRTLINPIMHGFANQMGRGTFLWEPTRYPDYNSHTLFDYANNTFTANATMAQYAALARSYGLPVPSTPAATLDATTCK
jgi:arabinogalactan endo-1,4-beta-galactosidase